MFLKASALVTGGFVVLPVLLGLGLVLASDWAGRRLGESPATRRRWAIGTGLGVVVWLLLTAVVATPAFAWFGRDRLNVWITYPPFVWLPAVIVTAALTGHLLVWRKLQACPN